MTPLKFTLPPGLCICRDQDCVIPFGKCHCECGKDTALAPQGHAKRGWIKGCPVKYITGHLVKYPTTKARDLPYRGVLDGCAVSYLPLAGGGHGIIDVDDEEKAEGLWFEDCGYILKMAERADRRKIKVRLHRLICNAPEDMEVDHINGNRKDNRKSNLRLVTRLENAKNRGIASNNTSGVTGVNWKKTRQMWEARIYVNGIRIVVCLSSVFEEAVNARNDAEERCYGRFRRMKK